VDTYPYPIAETPCPKPKENTDVSSKSSLEQKTLEIAAELPWNTKVFISGFEAKRGGGRTWRYWGTKTAKKEEVIFVRNGEIIFSSLVYPGNNKRVKIIPPRQLLSTLQSETRDLYH